jgi:hypothetical protein
VRGEKVKDSSVSQQVLASVYNYADTAYRYSYFGFKDTLFCVCFAQAKGNEKKIQEFWCTILKQMDLVIL